MLGRKHFLRRPAFCQTSAESTMRYAESSCPLSQAQRFPIVCQHSSFTSVLRLLKFCSPSTIAWFVVSVIVNTINSCIWRWFRSHVCDEVIEADFPSFAKRYASVCVQVFVFVVGVATSLHFLPRCVLGCLVSTSSTCSSASARLCASFAKFSSSHNSCIPTLTEALPSGIARPSVARELDHCEFGVNIPRFIFGARGQLDRIIRRHSSTPFQLDCDRAESVHHDCLGSFYFSKSLV
jgi:hypothetical protein